MYIDFACIPYVSLSFIDLIQIQQLTSIESGESNFWCDHESFSWINDLLQLCRFKQVASAKAALVEEKLELEEPTKVKEEAVVPVEDKPADKKEAEAAAAADPTPEESPAAEPEAVAKTEAEARAQLEVPPEEEAEAVEATGDGEKRAEGSSKVAPEPQPVAKEAEKTSEEAESKKEKTTETETPEADATGGVKDGAQPDVPATTEAEDKTV